MPLVDRLNCKKCPIRDSYKKILISKETATDLRDNRTFPIILQDEIVYTLDCKGLKTRIGKKAHYR